MLKFQFNVLAATILFASNFVTCSSAIAQTNVLGRLSTWQTMSTNQTDRPIVEQPNMPRFESAAETWAADAVVGSLSDKNNLLIKGHSGEIERTENTNGVTPQISATTVSSKKSVGLSSKPLSLQADATQDSQQRLRFNVNSYIGKLGQAEQIFAASKVEPLFNTTAIVVPDTQREHIDPQDPNIIMNWEDRVYTWVAPGLYHKPLYFQQVNLERYGIGPRPILQPAHSMMHFYGSIILWPGKMVWNRPAECTYTLGHQRPGDCVDYQRLSPE